MLTILFRRLESLFLIETLKTIMLKLNSLLSLLATWCQELNHQMTRCSKEDFSHIQILTDIDLEEITTNSQLTVHTEPELQITKETVPLFQMEIKEEL